MNVPTTINPKKVAGVLTFAVLFVGADYVTNKWAFTKKLREGQKVTTEDLTKWA